MVIAQLIATALWSCCWYFHLHERDQWGTKRLTWCGKHHVANLGRRWQKMVGLPLICVLVTVLFLTVRSRCCKAVVNIYIFFLSRGNSNWWINWACAKDMVRSWSLSCSSMSSCAKVHMASILMPRACPVSKSQAVAMVVLHPKCMRDSPCVQADQQEGCHAWKHLQWLVVQWRAQKAWVHWSMQPQSSLRHHGMVKPWQPWPHLGKLSQRWCSPPAPGAWHCITAADRTNECQAALLLNVWELQRWMWEAPWVIHSLPSLHCSSRSTSR